MPSPWTRPYAPSRARWLIVAWEFAALAFLNSTTRELFALQPRAATVLSAVLALLWLAGTWQIVRMGVYVGREGLRIRGLVSLRTVLWTDIAWITVDRGAYRIAGFDVPAGRTVVITLREGSRLNTPLWAKGIDFQFRPRVFREVYGVLRERHSAAYVAGPTFPAYRPEK